MSKVRLYVKIILTFAVLCVGGPALVIYVSPTDEELFKKYNPELQKRDLETRQQRKEDHNNFMRKLKDLSRSDKSVWEEMKSQAAREKANTAAEQRRQAIDSQKLRDEIKKEALGNK